MAATRDDGGMHPGEKDGARDEREIPPELCQVMVVAVRVSATLAGLPEHCRARACRKRRRCHVRLDREGRLVCKVGLSESVMDRACEMVAYLLALTKPEWRKDIHMRLPATGFRLNREGEG